MPVDSVHPSYTAHMGKWQRARDASTGQDAIHAGETSYLPKLTDQSDTEYDAYVKRSSYYNATGRTIDGLVGMVFRKEMVIDATGIDGIIDDVDLQGNSLSSFSQKIIRDVLTASRFGALVEYPRLDDDSSKTVAQKEEMNERPYASSYPTESIKNWKVERINNKMQSTLIVLQETYEHVIDEYESELRPQWRELRLEGGIYLQRVWRRKEKSKTFEQVGPDIIPQMNNAPLNFIPFYAFGSDSNTLDITDAPILPLADLNIAHYRVTADYENVSHFSGCPTLFIAGVENDDKNPIKVGSTTAIVTNIPDAHGEYIEVSSDANILERNLERKEKQMASIGARMLEQQKTGVESEGAMQMRANGENSVLAGIAKLTSDQLSNMLRFMAEWAGRGQDVTVTLNTDYMPVDMSPQQLTALVGAYQIGAMSKETLFENLKRGEVISEGVSFEDEQDRISTEEPNLATDGS